MIALRLSPMSLLRGIEYDKALYLSPHLSSSRYEVQFLYCLKIMIPSCSIFEAKKSSMLLCRRNTSTLQHSRDSRYCFSPDLLSRLGSISTQISTSLDSLFSFLATEPNNLIDCTPNRFDTTALFFFSMFMQSVLFSIPLQK